MATVFERLCIYENYNKFRFNHNGRKNIGLIIYNAWKADICNFGVSLPTIISQEPGGTFRVKDYPEHFNQKMDELIADYVHRITSKITKKIEKPTDPSPPKIASEPRKRNRIKTQQPAFSGKPLLKK